MKNPNCDGETCIKSTSEIRVLPIGQDSNALLCYSCFLHEIRFRKAHNKELTLDSKFELPKWVDLVVYKT